MNEMTPRLWRMSYQLAGELAQRNFDNNILKTAYSYLKAYPDADYLSWTENLAQLGDMFRSSDQTLIHRQEFWDACRRLQPTPENNQEWIMVLAWAARLFGFFKANPKQAIEVSQDLSRYNIANPPEPFMPPVVKREAPPNSDIPAPREKVSDFAKDFMAMLEKQSSKPQKRKKR